MTGRRRRHLRDRIRLSHMAVPPPLAPPHKGEGDDVIAASAKSIGGEVLEATPRFPLPLVGRGQGWGYEGRSGTLRISRAVALPGGSVR